VTSGHLYSPSGENAAPSRGATIHDPTDPMGKMFFNIVAAFAEFKADFIRMRIREGMAIARSKGRLKGKQPMFSDRQ